MAFTLFSGICNLFPVLSLLSVRLMPAAIQIGACSGNFAALHVALVYSLLWLWKILHILLHYVCHVSVKRRCEVKGEKILEALYQRQKNTHKCNTMRDKSWIVTEIVMALLHANATANNQPNIHRQYNVPPPDNRSASNCCISNARTHFHFFRYLLLHLYRKWSSFCCVRPLLFMAICLPYFRFWFFHLCLPSKYSVILTVSPQFIVIYIVFLFVRFLHSSCFICRHEV